MVMRALATGAALTTALMLVAAAATAQDSTTAGALFERGVADMEAQNFTSACPALEESQRIDPRPGTLFTLAECHAHWGKVARAAAEYQDYVDLVSRLTREQQQRHKARVDMARSQLAALKPSIPTLTLVLPPDAPAGTFVTRNGEVLKGAALGLTLPVDPGQYVIVTHVPGAPDRETKVDIALGDAARVTLDTTPPASKPPAPPLPASPAAPAKPAPIIAADSPPRTGGGGHGVAYLAGGIGIAGIVVGTVTGILVLGKAGTVSDNCTGHACNKDGLDAVDSGRTLATVSNIGFGVGIAGLATGVILLLAGGSDPTAATQARVDWQPVFATDTRGFVTGLARRW